MADTIIARGAAETPRLDTISYYNDSEPNWNERPYFTKVEEKRGRTGCHIDVSKQEPFNLEFENDRFAATPGSGGGCPSESEKKYLELLTSQENRVVLSGVGGDEVMGGVPTPTPELENLLARAQFSTLAHQLKVWALNKRKPWFHLLLEAARGFFPVCLIGVPNYKKPAPWIDSGFIKRNRVVLEGYHRRLKLFGPLPSFQNNISTLDVLRRQLACSVLSSDPSHERRYPFLDRSLLEFAYAIPREQLVRPGQRRSLMRRALVGVVPDELLNRKRKAYFARAPMAAISREWAGLIELSQHTIAGSLGIVDPSGFRKALEEARRGRAVPIVALLRTIATECWLQALRRWQQPHNFAANIPTADYRARNELTSETMGLRLP